VLRERFLTSVFYEPASQVTLQWPEAMISLAGVSVKAAQQSAPERRVSNWPLLQLCFGVKTVGRGAFASQHQQQQRAEDQRRSQQWSQSGKTGSNQTGSN